MTPRALAWLARATAVALAAACHFTPDGQSTSLLFLPPPVTVERLCNPGTCTGCCAGGVCLQGPNAALDVACGSRGAACVDCAATGQSCGAQGACVPGDGGAAGQPDGGAVDAGTVVSSCPGFSAQCAPEPAGPRPCQCPAGTRCRVRRVPVACPGACEASTCPACQESCLVVLPPGGSYVAAGDRQAVCECVR